MYAWIDLLASESLKKLYMETLILILVLHHFRSNILNDHDSGRNYDAIFQRSPPNTITTADNHSYRSDCTGQHILTACGTCRCCCYHHCTQCCRCHSTNFPRFFVSVFVFFFFFADRLFPENTRGRAQHTRSIRGLRMDVVIPFQDQYLHFT